MASTDSSRPSVLASSSSCPKVDLSSELPHSNPQSTTHAVTDPGRLGRFGVMVRSLGDKQLAHGAFKDLAAFSKLISVCMMVCTVERFSLLSLAPEVIHSYVARQYVSNEPLARRA